MGLLKALTCHISSSLFSFTSLFHNTAKPWGRCKKSYIFVLFFFFPFFLFLFSFKYTFFLISGQQAVYSAICSVSLLYLTRAFSTFRQVSDKEILAVPLHRQHCNAKYYRRKAVAVWCVWKMGITAQVFLPPRTQFHCPLPTKLNSL